MKRRRSLLFDTRFGPSAFRPVVDGALLKELPMQAMAAGRTISVPVLIGTNLDELRILSALYDTPVEQKPQEFLTKANVVPRPAVLRAVSKRFARHPGFVPSRETSNLPLRDNPSRMCGIDCKSRLQ